MSKKTSSAQKLGMVSITDTVFNLDDGCKAILHILAKHGRQYIWNMTKLSKDEPTQLKLNQKLVYRRLFGTPNLFSLLEKEYVIERPYTEKQRGHPTKIYTLTLKGILAALSTGIVIDEIKPFQNYIEFVCSKIINNKFKTLIKNYIKCQIHFFLVWHAAHGIQLQSQIGSNEYFTYFFNNFVKLPRKINTDSKYRGVYQSTLKNFLVVQNTMSMLDFIADPNREVGIAGESDTVREKIYKNFTSTVQYDYETPSSFQKTGEHVIGLIQEWPFFMQYLHQDNARNVINVTDTRTPFYLDEKERNSNGIILEIPTYNNRVRKNLAEFMSEKTVNAVMMYFSSKSFEPEFRLYRQTRFP